MKKNICNIQLVLFLLVFISYATTGDNSKGEKTATQSEVSAAAIQGTPFGPAEEFAGSPKEEIGRSGLFDVYPASSCQIAVLRNGDDSFASRVQTLRNAKKEVLIGNAYFVASQAFAESEDAVYQFQKEFGILIEDSL